MMDLFHVKYLLMELLIRVSSFFFVFFTCSKIFKIFVFILEFDTSRLEMGAVADLFDRNNEGLIDWQEFIAALRPDWQERKPAPNTDVIHDEVKRLVMLCTCRQKFRVFQVGEGKYRVSCFCFLMIYLLIFRNIYFCITVLKTVRKKILLLRTVVLSSFF